MREVGPHLKHRDLPGLPQTSNSQHHPTRHRWGEEHELAVLAAKKETLVEPPSPLPPDDRTRGRCRQEQRRQEQGAREGLQNERHAHKGGVRSPPRKTVPRCIS